MSGYDEFFKGAAETADPPFVPAFAEAESHVQKDPLPPPTYEDAAKNYGEPHVTYEGPGRAGPQPQDRPSIK